MIKRLFHHKRRGSALAAGVVLGGLTMGLSSLALPTPSSHTPSPVTLALVYQPTETAEVRYPQIVVPVHKKHRQIDHDAIILRAIRHVESEDNPRKVGGHGERGLYQFKRKTWRQHTRRPFNEAHTEFAHQIANEHLEWVKQQLNKQRTEPSAYNIALCWNLGVTAAATGSIPRETRDYAQRVNNLYGAYLVEEQAVDREIAYYSSMLSAKLAASE